MNRRPPRFQSAKRAGHDSQAPSTLWLFGLHSVDEALRNGHRIKHRLIVTRNAAAKLKGAIEESGIQCELADARNFRAPIDKGSVHQGAALEVSPLSPPALEELARNNQKQVPFVLLDRVTDPHNVGAILRTAWALGAAAVVAPARHSPPETGALAKSASGALEHVPFLRVRNLGRAIKSLQDEGYLVAGFDSDSGRSMNSARMELSNKPLCLVFGSEGSGLREGTRGNCDIVLAIGSKNAPVPLNVSNAVAIALHAVTEDRPAIKGS